MIGRVMESGLLTEAVCQAVGIPSSLAMVSSDMARTSDETPIMVKIRKDAQAMARAVRQRRCFAAIC